MSGTGSRVDRFVCGASYGLFIKAILKGLMKMDHMALLRNAASRRDVLYRSDPLLVVRGFRGRYFKIYGTTAQIDYPQDLLECVADLFMEVEYSIYGKAREDVLTEMVEARGEELQEVLQGVSAWAPIE